MNPLQPSSPPKFPERYYRLKVDRATDRIKLSRKLLDHSLYNSSMEKLSEKFKCTIIGVTYRWIKLGEEQTEGEENLPAFGGFTTGKTLKTRLAQYIGLFNQCVKNPEGKFNPFIKDVASNPHAWAIRAFEPLTRLKELKEAETRAAGSYNYSSTGSLRNMGSGGISHNALIRDPDFDPVAIEEAITKKFGSPIKVRPSKRHKNLTSPLKSSPLSLVDGLFCSTFSPTTKRKLKSPRPLVYGYSEGGVLLYIGQTNNLERRLKQESSHKGLKKAVKKGGVKIKIYGVVDIRKDPRKVEAAHQRTRKTLERDGLGGLNQKYGGGSVARITKKIKLSPK